MGGVGGVGGAGGTGIECDDSPADRRYTAAEDSYHDSYPLIDLSYH